MIHSPFPELKRSFQHLSAFFLYRTRTLLLYTAVLSLAFALHSCTPTRLDVQAEGTESDEAESGDSETDNAAKPGIKIGVAVVAKPSSAPSKSNSAEREDHEFKPMNDGGLAFRTELAFVQKGSKIQDSKTTLNYLEVTEDLFFEHKFENNGALFGGVGPYIAYGIGGKAGNSSFKTNSFGSDGYKRFDLGLNVMGGYRLPSGLFFMLGYDYGLVNKSSQSDFTSKNRSFQFGVGYSVEKLSGMGRKK